MTETTEQKIHGGLGHPDDRSATDITRNRISLRDHVVRVEIGAFQQERNQTQRLRFNLVVDLPPECEKPDDDVDRILSYDVLTDAISQELSAERLNLLETLAERIARRILQEPQAQQVILRIEKLDRGSGALGVEILRQKADVPATGKTATVPERIIWLPFAALQAAALPDAVNGWVRQTPASVICVAGPPSTPAVPDPAVQLRLDLLAAEQAAWVLAALCPDLGVISSRTEMDWAMKSASPSVWAPSKIVLDSLQEVSPEMIAGPRLGVWLARFLAVKNLAVVGEALPKVTDINVVRLKLADLAG